MKPEFGSFGLDLQRYNGLRRSNDTSLRKVETTLTDPFTYDLIELPALLETLDTTETKLGSIILERSLRQPLDSVEAIQTKQQAVAEVTNNPELRDALRSYEKRLAEKEDYLFSLLFANYTLRPFDYPNLYQSYKQSKKYLTSLAHGPEIHPESPYLQELLTDLDTLERSDIFGWMNKPMVRTLKGLKDNGERHLLEPRLAFHPTDIKPLVYIGLSTPYGALSLLFRKPGDPFSERDLMLAGGMSLTVMLMMGIMLPIATRGADDQVFIRPFASKIFSNHELAKGLEAAGKIDELLALVNYADKLGGYATLPMLVESQTHTFSAKGLKNPLRTIYEGSYVPNDVDLRDTALTFLTGPNSGGKTSLSKTIAQAQALAQIGSYIPAESATISVADKVFYQAPMINSLTDSEGRFGVEVGRVADIFYQTTPKSLIFLDELIEATTYEERLEYSYDILDAFSKIGANVVLVTHNHELAEKFQSEGRGQYWQVEFIDEEATHKIKPGISHESHAGKVMERQGFTKEDMKRYLEEKGYL